MRPSRGANFWQVEAFRTGAGGRGVARRGRVVCGVVGVLELGQIERVIAGSLEVSSYDVYSESKWLLLSSEV